MSGLDEEQVPVTFRDVAASFSEEEWKLLHERQKELYKNVMKEIHQALILLGYQIVNTNILFRINKREEMCIRNVSKRADTNDPTSSVYRSSNPDIILRIKQEEEPHCSNWYGLHESGIHDSHSTGFPFLSPNTCLGIEDETNVSLRDPCGAEVGESSTCLSSGHSLVQSGVSVGIKEEREEYSLYHEVSERKKSINNPTGDSLVTSLITRSIKLEEEAHFREEQEPEGRATGNGSMNREGKNDSSVAGIGKITTCKAMSGKIITKVLQCSEKHTASHLWTESNQRLGGEKTAQRESGVNNPEHSNLYQGVPREERSDAYKCANNLRNAKRICQLNAQQNWRLYRCNECDKSFRMKNTLLKHRRIHTGERPYHCSVCHKSFIQKHHLIGHQRRHTGERPYQCTKCTKSFPWKESLIAHQRTHAGRVQFQCTKCRKVFSQKGDLIIHQRTHAGESNVNESPNRWKLLSGQLKVERPWCSASSSAEHYPTMP